MSSENFDEEGLLKDIRASELAGAITTLTWNWDSYPDASNEAHKLLDQVRHLFLEISEYDQRMGSKLTKYQRNQIINSVEDLKKQIPFLKRKIEATIAVEEKSDNEDLR